MCHVTSNIIPFSWLYFQSYLPKCYIMDAVAMLLSSEHVRPNKLYSAFVMIPTFQGYLYAYPAPAICHCYYHSRIFVVPTLSFYQPQWIYYFGSILA